jgi:hypothetical protein
MVSSLVLHGEVGGVVVVLDVGVVVVLGAVVVGGAVVGLVVVDVWRVGGSELVDVVAPVAAGAVVFDVTTVVVEVLVGGAALCPDEPQAAVPPARTIVVATTAPTRAQRCLPEGG